MICPWLIRENYKLCSASDIPYSSNLNLIEQYCFNIEFKVCPIFKNIFKIKTNDYEIKMYKEKIR